MTNPLLYPYIKTSQTAVSLELSYAKPTIYLRGPCFLLWYFHSFKIFIQFGNLKVVFEFLSLSNIADILLNLTDLFLSFWDVIHIYDSPKV